MFLNCPHCDLTDNEERFDVDHEIRLAWCPDCHTPFHVDSFEDKSFDDTIDELNSELGAAIVANSH